MSAKLPILKKTPFVLDPRPLTEASSPHAGALAISRVFRSLGYPGMIEANLNMKKRDRGFKEGQMIEQIVMLACSEQAGLRLRPARRARHEG